MKSEKCKMEIAKLRAERRPIPLRPSFDYAQDVASLKGRGISPLL